MSRLRRAIETFDIESYVHQTFDPVEESGDDELRVNCFSPDGCNGSDIKQHLWVNTVKRKWICYKCGYGDQSQQAGTGSLIRFMADSQRATDREIKDQLINAIHVTPADELKDLVSTIFDEEKPTKEVKEIKLPTEFKKVECFPESALRYLERRGFERDHIDSFDIRFCSPTVSRYPLWRRRLVFPIYDLEGRIRSIQGRILEPAPAKYNKHPRWRVWADSDIQKTMWPLGQFIEGDWVSIRTLNPKHVIIVEGIPDAHAVQLVTGYFALAAFGKKLSEKQVALLQDLDLEEVTVAFDYEGRSKMQGIVKKLVGRFDRVSIFPFLWPGWQTYDFGDMLDVRYEAVQFCDHFVKDILARYQHDSPEFLRWVSEVRF